MHYASSTLPGKQNPVWKCQHPPSASKADCNPCKVNPADAHLDGLPPGSLQNGLVGLLDLPWQCPPGLAAKETTQSSDYSTSAS